MPQWSKTLTLIIVLTAYVATVVTTIARGELPDATLLGVPIAAIVALAPPVTIGRNRAGTDGTPASPATDEGDTA